MLLCILPICIAYDRRTIAINFKYIYKSLPGKEFSNTRKDEMGKILKMPAPAGSGVRYD